MKPTFHRAAFGLALLAACAGAQAASFIQAVLEVRETSRPPGPNGADGGGGNTSVGAPIQDVASFGSGSVGVDLVPQLGQGSMLGQSAPLNFSDGVLNVHTTLADGGIEISDHLHINGNVGGPVQGLFVVHMTGVLLPALPYEVDALLAGRPSVTASAHGRAEISYRNAQGLQSASEQVDQIGSWLGPGNPCTMGCRVGTTVDIMISLPMFIDATGRDFNFTMSFTGVGNSGGGFDFSAPAVVPGQAPRAGGSAISAQVLLPEGLSYTADGGYYVSSGVLGAVPEPAPARLFATAPLAAGLLRLWRRRAD